jgi:hypothetical protein
VSGGTLLVDGNNVLMRAVWATHRSPMNADGVPTGPLLVFANTLARHIREEAPERVAVAWDGGHSTERVALSPEYKGNRPGAPDEDLKRSSFALAKEFLALANVYSMEVHGKEADDLISAWWAGSRESVTIVSSDKDFLQLVGRNPHLKPVDQIRLSSSDTPTDRWDAARVLADMGCEPWQLPMVMALAGDKVDNVVGVRGIGPKKAIKGLTLCGWDFMTFCHGLTEEEGRERVITNLRLVDLRHPDFVLPPPPAFRPTGPDDLLHESLTSFVNRYRLESLRERLLVTGSFWSGTEGGRSTPGRPFSPNRT